MWVSATSRPYYDSTNSPTPDLPHNHWWRRAFHTTRRAYYERRQNSTGWLSTGTTPGRVHESNYSKMPRFGFHEPQMSVDFEKVLIYVVNMIFFYLCIRLFFRFMRQMRERRLQRESHLATLNAQIDMLEHHIEMLNEANIHGKCRNCAESEGLPNYEDVVGPQDETSRLLTEDIPMGLPVSEVIYTAPVHATHAENHVTENQEPEEEQNNGPFLHV
ncbi:hypothetical protein L596_029541 [Steinernema carpocapsae]|uniref:Uncharacterized protein n=1 Tax=Steinernema carpocapsae TaxID=34508 RepID=A0A4V5ZXQ7_STECR|nr:hypothetical protein L596_029541 [Steinernema carpocapsae]